MSTECILRTDAQEHDMEWGQLIDEVRQLAKRLETAALRGDVKSVERHNERLQELGQQVAYAHRRWRRMGAWTRYYQVRDGVVHTSLGCRHVNIHTVVRVLFEWAGIPLSEAYLRLKMCRHCGTKETREFDTPEIMEALFHAHHLHVTL